MDDIEFAAALAELRSDPEGWQSTTHAGRRVFHQVDSFSVTPPRPSWEQVGNVTYPDWFEITIWTVDRREGFVCVLGYELLNGDFELVEAMSQGMGLLAAINHVSSVPGGLAFWKRRALMLLAAFGSNSEGLNRLDAIDDIMTPDGAQAAWGRARQALEIPASTRRDRVTVDVLQEASGVYREAWRDGKNPTQAVAAHFHKSHSTAARWVGQARKLGLLGPANGSLGGEVELPPRPTPDTQAVEARDV